MSQKGCNILVTRSTIPQLQILVSRWWTTLDCEMPSSPDTLPKCYLPNLSLWLRAWPQKTRSTWLCWIVEVLATQVKLLKPSSYYTVINCIFTFCKDVLVIFLVLCYNPVWTMLHVHLCGFQIAHRVKKCTTCQCTNYHYITNHNGYLPWLELLQSYDICTAN